MQTNREDLYMHDDHVSTPSRRFKTYGSSQGDMDNSEMSIDFSDSNLPKARNLTSQLQNVSESLTGMTANFNIKIKGDEQNVDMENCSTQSSSLDSSQALTRESSTATWISQTDFSAKCRAPVKQSNTRKYRLLRGFDKEIISATEFLHKLNSTESEDKVFSMLDNQTDDRSLEQHIEDLAKTYSRDDINMQSQKVVLGDLYMRFIPKTCFAKGMQIILQSKKIYYQKVKKGNTRICITMPATVNHEDLLRQNRLFSKSRSATYTCFEFFNQINSDFWEKGFNIKVKVNEEPIFPAKTTLEYLCMHYKNSEAKVKLIQ